MYEIKDLLQIFLNHAIEHEKMKEEVAIQFRKNFPDCDIPECMKEEFSLPLALASICEAILKLK